MTIRKLHFVMGLSLTLFVGFHLINHLWSVFGPEAHIELMNAGRVVYRNVWVESILLMVVAVQIVSGLRLFRATRHSAINFFQKLHRWTGLYLALFFFIHLNAVLGGRLLLHLDTNFYFGVAGLNTFPFNLFFVPYYGLAIVSFFGHIAAVHHKKMTHYVVGLSPAMQSKGILLAGIVLTLVIFYGLTNGFMGVRIPAEYNMLIGK
jgi:hypothetical protein